MERERWSSEGEQEGGGRKGKEGTEIKGMGEEGEGRIRERKERETWMREKKEDMNRRGGIKVRDRGREEQITQRHENAERNGVGVKAEGRGRGRGELEEKGEKYYEEGWRE